MYILQEMLVSIAALLRESMWLTVMNLNFKSLDARDEFLGPTF